MTIFDRAAAEIDAPQPAIAPIAPVETDGGPAKAERRRSQKREAARRFRQKLQTDPDSVAQRVASSESIVERYKGYKRKSEQRPEYKAWRRAWDRQRYHERRRERAFSQADDDVDDDLSQ